MTKRIVIGVIIVGALAVFNISCGRDNRRNGEVKKETTETPALDTSNVETPTSIFENPILISELCKPKPNTVACVLREVEALQEKLTNAQIKNSTEIIALVQKSVNEAKEILKRNGSDSPETLKTLDGIMTSMESVQMLAKEMSRQSNSKKLSQELISSAKEIKLHLCQIQDARQFVTACKN